MAIQAQFKTINTFDEYPTIIQHRSTPSKSDRASQLISIWNEIHDSKRRVRVQAFDLRSGVTDEDKDEKEGVVQVDAVSHRQLLFTRRIQDMAQRLTALPGNSDFVLSHVACTPPPSHSGISSVPHFGASRNRDAVFEGQTQFAIVANYSGRKRFGRRLAKSFRIRCESCIAPQWLSGRDEITALSQSMLNAMVGGSSTKMDRGEITVVFCPAGWRGDITLPVNVALVEFTPSGKWTLKHTVRDGDTLNYLEAIFKTEPHEERMNCSVDSTLYRH